MPHRSDDDDRPRRRRPRRGRKHGSNTGMWVALGGLALLIVVGGVVAVVVARKGGRDGAGGTPGADDVAGVFGGRGAGAKPPGAREITAAEFQEIKKEDSLAALEARFGPARRYGPAELDNLYLSMVNRGHDARLKISFGRRLRETYRIANPECYHWSGGGTDVYLVPAEGHPAANLHLKWYNRRGTNERGEFHGQTIFEDFLNDGKPPPLQPPGN